MDMKASSLMNKAKELIDSVRGVTLSEQERATYAVEAAALMLQEAQRIQTRGEWQRQKEVAGMINDPLGKLFTMGLTDQCFRSHEPRVVASQVLYLLKKYRIPRFLPFYKKAMIAGFELLGYPLADLFVPMLKHFVRKQTSTVILPGEPGPLIQHIRRRHCEGVQVNLNHLGEAILGEEEASHRLQLYLEDLANPAIGCISIKISTLFSQLNLLDWEGTVDIVCQRLKQLYRMAQKHSYKGYDQAPTPKFVNLDMEEYRDLHLTVDIFRRALDDPEFKNYSAGIALQSYLPDSFDIQRELTDWAKARVASGGASISIRIVKGANLAMEQVEASLRGWPQAPYATKSDVDANYKRMVTYGCSPGNARAVHIGIASHNLFDIAYGLLLRSENGLDREVTFEMLEGMADAMRRVVQQLSGRVLLYCPVATESEFQNAVAYLIRRLDENTAPENFLRQSFSLTVASDSWEHQKNLFIQSCRKMYNVRREPFRQQNRLNEPQHLDPCSEFDNEADTDWTLLENRQWVYQAVAKLKQSQKGSSLSIPLVIDGKEVLSSTMSSGIDPSCPEGESHRYSLAQIGHIDQALQAADRAQSRWRNTSIADRARLLVAIAQELRRERGNLISVMIANTGKTAHEADVEISEAIDFAEYYWRVMQEWDTLQDISWRPKGTIVVAPPWNFPCSIPAGGMLAALMTGNCVIFKPAQEAVWVGWLLAQIFWKAGVDKSVLQFITCEDDPVGSSLIKDPRVSSVVLTGATDTAKLLLKLRPGLDLMAETGGKNAMIISHMADRDLAVKHLIQSAFGHAGQKCSACSLAICHAEVYDDPQFRKQLRDAAASLVVGSAWDYSTAVSPLIRNPGPTLHKGLTSLEKGEEWLLEPRQDTDNPQLWSPGIKIGVSPESFTYTNELFGPVLSVMRADNLDHAIELANGTRYGLTSGLHSLDQEEIQYWLGQIEAGNCYVNRGITGAIVQRQPFGGCKESSFGRGLKAGGPNYLVQFMHAEQVSLPEEDEEAPPSVIALGKVIEKDVAFDKQIWERSIASYAFYHNHYFVLDHDPSMLKGQDNILHYVPHSQCILRIQNGDAFMDVIRVIAAASVSGCPLVVSGDVDAIVPLDPLDRLGLHNLEIFRESEEEFISHLGEGQRLRLVSIPSTPLLQACAQRACHVIALPVLATGRLELLNYIREVSISIDYHRYGNLGEREGDIRDKNIVVSKKSCCHSCDCIPK